ncbi:unnamed protein product, partial [Haemonchus placei]|uniref:Reverse transcriptase domain-containing protein n=1 Tax=Haemonchus placei TaxID=6290 RepID=A0A0N4WLB8_HAEPC
LTTHSFLRWIVTRPSWASNVRSTRCWATRSSRRAIRSRSRSRSRLTWLVIFEDLQKTLDSFQHVICLRLALTSRFPHSSRCSRPTWSSRTPRSSFSLRRSTWPWRPTWSSRTSWSSWPSLRIWLVSAHWWTESWLAILWRTHHSWPMSRWPTGATSTSSHAETFTTSSFEPLELLLPTL